jgi:exodeoxyribonuclease V
MILNSFFNKNFSPTSNQKVALTQLDSFLKSNENVMILKGFAGTGKTTIVAALVSFLEATKREYFLLAPTGKAAKVMSIYSHRFATTIHKKIYRQQNIPGTYNFVLGTNVSRGGVFIVDEASMIGFGNEFNTNGLLYDLFEYLYNGESCQLIFVGDTAQLPPIGEIESPALNPSAIKREFVETCNLVELTEVVRQAKDSGILVNATKIRELIENQEVGYPKFELNVPEIKLINGGELQECIEQAYYNFGEENTVILTRSNKYANSYNQQIRNRIFDYDTEITGGEKLMVVKNNYFFTKEYEKLGFIANGDTLEIKKVLHEVELYGFKFMDVVARLKDYDADPEIEIKIILESLHSLGPALTKEQNNELIQNITLDYPEEPSRRKKWQLIKENPYFNAVQVKYAYAITGHKAQGGQWDCVFVDQSFFIEDMLNIDYLRWLYTCFTRAKKQLYLVNFKPEFFS